MGGTYKATGINLKSIPLGENDRLLTILSEECGLIRAVAPGARKHKSSLRGCSRLFVLNTLLLTHGRSLDKVIQAECIETFPTISQDLGKLTAGQYLSELVLCQAIEDNPQVDLFALLRRVLDRLNQIAPSFALPTLVQAIYDVLVYGGLTPQVFQCCLSQNLIIPDWSNPNWYVYFDAASGGMISTHQSSFSQSEVSDHASIPTVHQSKVSEHPTGYESSRSLHSFSPIELTNLGSSSSSSFAPSSLRTRRDRQLRLNANEVFALQKLAQPDILKRGSKQSEAFYQKREHPALRHQTIDNDDGLISSGHQADMNDAIAPETWLSVERVLRHYAQYHLDQPIRSAALIDTCFSGHA